MSTGQSGESEISDAVGRLREASEADPTADASRVRRLGEEVAEVFSNPELVDATDIVQWADRPEAATLLPELVRRLVLASEGVTRVGFRAGEGVRYPGWDGTAETTQATTHPFIPSGRSYWEIGTSRDVKRKAADDLEARSALSGEDHSGGTYVFVTPRRWARKDQWAQEQLSRLEWEDLRVYDADDLEAWLQIVPSVHYWFSERIGKDPLSATALDSWWREWSDATDPATTPELVVAGREDEARELAKRFEGATGIEVIQGESTEEAVAFIAAAAETSDTDARWRYRAVAVRTLAAWDRLRLGSGLVLVPLVDIQATNQDSARHLIAIPATRGLGPEGRVQLVPRITREGAESALREMGIEETALQELSVLARRSLLVLRRRIAVSPRMRNPEWANADDADVLIPINWCGAWEERREEDRSVLGRLMDLAPDRVNRSLARLAYQPDSPIRKIGGAWYIISRDDSWYALMPFVREDHVDRFVEVAVEVLTRQDPTLSLPIEDRWQSSVLGVQSRESELLRDGLSEGLAFLGARASTDDVAGQSGADLARLIVNRILSAANEDMPGMVWASVAPTLPTLAEAAPEAFLDAVEVGLTGDSMRNIFQDSATDSFGSSSSPHTGLLWALEDLAWFREYLIRAASALAQLADVDPGGRLSNRPSGSLREIFLPWHPSTTATISERLDVLAALRQRYPKVTWTLLVSLLPKNHDIASFTYQPRIRALPATQHRATRKDVYDFTAAILPWLLDDAGIDGQRWADILEAVDDLPKELAERVLNALSTSGAEAFSDDSRRVIWNRLRVTITHHRAYRDAEWAMPEELLTQLEDAYSKFQPGKILERSLWLFASHPPLVERQWDEYQTELRRLRQGAVSDLLRADGLAGVEQLATQVERPDEVGVALGLVISSEDGETIHRAAVDELLADDERLRRMGAGYVFSRFEQKGWEWAEDELTTLRGWPAESIAQFLLALPAEPRTWNQLRRFDKEVAAEYWRLVYPLAVRDDADIPTAVKDLIAFGRPLAAVDLLGNRIDSTGHDFDVELVLSTLEAATAATADEFQTVPSLAYVVDRLLVFLDRRGADLTRIARVEWSFLPLLSDSERESTTLHQFLTQDPAFFVSAMTMMYKAEGEHREATSEDRARSRLAYELLRSWHLVPGSQSDGTIDGEVMNAWIDQARTLAADAGRSKIADEHIGNVLRYAPGDGDGLWPPLVVRGVVERLASPELETGLIIEVFNSRGTTTRGLAEGGRQEHELAARYFSYETKLGVEWPRTRALLHRIGESFESDAKRQDDEANLRQDLS
jgi:hypothetical protein